MEKKQLTKEDWAKFVSKNCSNSYSLVICLATLLLWEEPGKEPQVILKGLGLSGAQAEMAIGFVKGNDLAVTNLQGNPLTDDRNNLLDLK